MKEIFMIFNSFVDKYIYEKKIIYVLIFFISLFISTICLLYLTNVCFSKITAIILVSILGILDLDLIIYNIIKSEYKAEHIFVSFVIPMGLALCLLMIPNFGSDESAHAYRSYVISDGYLISDRNDNKSPRMMVPEALLHSISEVHTYKELGYKLKESTDYNKKVEVNPDGVGASSYFFVGYILPAVTYEIGEIFNINIYIVYILARISNFLLFVLLIYYAIKLLPIGKYALLVLCLNPMIIQTAGTITMDTLINAMSMLLIAYVLNKKFVDKRIKTKDIIILALLSILLSIMKYAYFPLVISLLLLINKKNNKKTNISLISIVVISIILAIATYFFFNSYYVMQISYLLANGIDPSKQISFIIHNPFSYLIVLANTTINNGSFYFFTLFGRNLGNYTIIIPEIYQIIYFVIFLMALFIEKNKYELSTINRLFIILIFIMVYVIVETGLYIGWSKIGAPVVEGIQGRYFIPIAILPCLCLVRKHNNLVFKYGKLCVVMCSLLIYLVSIYKIMKYFNY